MLAYSEVRVKENIFKNVLDTVWADLPVVSNLPQLRKGWSASDREATAYPTEAGAEWTPVRQTER